MVERLEHLLAGRLDGPHVQARRALRRRHCPDAQPRPRPAEASGTGSRRRAAVAMAPVSKLGGRGVWLPRRGEVGYLRRRLNGGR